MYRLKLLEIFLLNQFFFRLYSIVEITYNFWKLNTITRRTVGNTQM